MKELPILYQPAMVRAQVAGTKTQTRRPLYVMTKNAFKACFDQRYPPSYGGGKWPNVPVGSAWTLSQWRKAKPGDVLWTREAWRTVAEADGMPPRNLTPAHRLWYEADEPHQPGFGKYRPPMFMPRWACRITREVVSVRVERLQAISEADAKAEGCDPLQVEAYWPPADLAYFPLAEPENPYRSGYAALWEAINGHGTWATNPWVVAIEFQPLEKT